MATSIVSRPTPHSTRFIVSSFRVLVIAFHPVLQEVGLGDSKTIATNIAVFQWLTCELGNLPETQPPLLPSVGLC